MWVVHVIVRMLILQIKWWDSRWGINDCLLTYSFAYLLTNLLICLIFSRRIARERRSVACRRRSVCWSATVSGRYCGWQNYRPMISTRTDSCSSPAATTANDSVPTWRPAAARCSAVCSNTSLNRIWRQRWAMLTSAYETNVCEFWEDYRQADNMTSSLQAWCKFFQEKTGGTWWLLMRILIAFLPILHIFFIF